MRVQIYLQIQKHYREETVDVSRLIRVFVNNYESHKHIVLSNAI